MISSLRTLVLTGLLPLALAADVPTGRTVPKAESMLQKPSDAEAQYHRGVQFAEGNGVPQDYGKAAKCYRAAAEKGLAEAQYSLGYLYENGLGVERDFKQAAAWYRKAALQGGPEAQNNLGVLYATGQGVQRDDSQALHWYRLAAAQNDPEATSNLGTMYLQGRAVKQDFARAFQLFLKAAQSGYPVAQNNLAIMYANGQSVAKDYVLAYAWLDVASQQAPACSDLRDRIAKEMKPEEIARARDIAAQKGLRFPRKERNRNDDSKIAIGAGGTWYGRQCIARGRPAVCSTETSIRLRCAGAVHRRADHADPPR